MTNEQLITLIQYDCSLVEHAVSPCYHELAIAKLRAAEKMHYHATDDASRADDFWKAWDEYGELK